MPPQKCFITKQLGIIEYYRISEYGKETSIKGRRINAFELKTLTCLVQVFNRKCCTFKSTLYLRESLQALLYKRPVVTHLISNFRLPTSDFID